MENHAGMKHLYVLKVEAFIISGHLLRLAEQEQKMWKSMRDINLEGCMQKKIC